MIAYTDSELALQRFSVAQGIETAKMVLKDQGYEHTVVNSYIKSLNPNKPLTMPQMNNLIADIVEDTKAEYTPTF